MEIRNTQEFPGSDTGLPYLLQKPRAVILKMILFVPQTGNTVSGAVVCHDEPKGTTLMLNAAFLDTRQESRQCTYASTVKRRIPTRIEHSNTKYCQPSQFNSIQGSEFQRFRIIENRNTKNTKLAKDTIHSRMEFCFNAPKNPIIDLEQQTNQISNQTTLNSTMPFQILQLCKG